MKQFSKNIYTRNDLGVWAFSCATNTHIKFVEFQIMVPT